MGSIRVQAMKRHVAKSGTIALYSLALAAASLIACGDGDGDSDFESSPAGQVNQDGSVRSGQVAKGEAVQFWIDSPVGETYTANLLNVSGNADLLICSLAPCKSTGFADLGSDSTDGTASVTFTTTTARTYVAPLGIEDALFELTVEGSNVDVLTVVSTTPANGAIDVAANASIIVQFSKALDLDSVGGNVSIMQGSNSVPLTTQLDGATVTVVPDAVMTDGSTYVVTLDATMTSIAGGIESLGADYTFSFTVGTPVSAGTALTFNTAVTGQVLETGTTHNFNFTPTTTGQHTVFIFERTQSSDTWTLNFDGADRYLYGDGISTDGAGSQTAGTQYNLAVASDASAAVTYNIIVVEGAGLMGASDAPVDLGTADGSEATYAMGKTGASEYHYFSFTASGSAAHRVVVTSNVLDFGFEIFNQPGFNLANVETVNVGLQTCWSSSGVASCPTYNTGLSGTYYIRLHSNTPTDSFDPTVTVQVLATP